jgi:hypothetical protein
VNPDFAEAVEYERAIVKTCKQFVSESTEHLENSLNTTAVVKRQIEGVLELQKGRMHIEQLLENKGLNKVVDSMRRSVTVQSEITEALQSTNKAQSEIIELNKKARNPNRVIGGKRDRHRGSKSKAVSLARMRCPITTWFRSAREQKLQQP